MAGEIYIEKAYYDGKQLWYKVERFPYGSEDRCFQIAAAITKAKLFARQTKRFHRVSEKSFETTQKGGAFVIWGPVYYRHFYLIKKLERPFVALFPYKERLVFK